MLMRPRPARRAPPTHPPPLSPDPPLANPLRGRWDGAGIESAARSWGDRDTWGPIGTHQHPTEPHRAPGSPGGTRGGLKAPVAAPRCPKGLQKRPAPPLPIRSALRADITPPAELPDASPRDFRFTCTALPAPAYVQKTPQRLHAGVSHGRRHLAVRRPEVARWWDRKETFYGHQFLIDPS